MKYNELTVSNILKLHSSGESSRQIARILGLSKSGVNNVINRNKFGSAKAKVLFLDLENAPSIAAAFQRFNVNLSPNHILEEGGWLLSIAWSWMNSKKIEGEALTSAEAVMKNDYRLVSKCWELIEEADIVIAHNGDRFDLPLIKARGAYHGFTALRKIKSVDTLKIAKSMKFESNKLDSLGNYLGVGRKETHTGITLWIECMEGNKQSLKKMLSYNKQDVQLLMDVYYKIRACDPNPPNMGLFGAMNQPVCKVCGSDHLAPTGNVVKAGSSSYEEVQCLSCGARARTRQSLTTKDQRKNLLA